MPNITALSLMVSEKEVLKDFTINKRAMMALDRSPEMLKKTNYRTKIWPSELLF